MDEHSTWISTYSCLAHELGTQVCQMDVVLRFEMRHILLGIHASCTDGWISNQNPLMTITQPTPLWLEIVTML